MNVLLSRPVSTRKWKHWDIYHKLDEWHTLCDWIERLPYSELITGKEEKADV